MSTMAEDKLIRGVRHIRPEKLVPLWLTLAVQTFVKIQHILDNGMDRGLTGLEEETQRIESMVKQNLEFHKICASSTGQLMMMEASGTYNTARTPE